jgi:hypothetical protein
MRSFTKRKQRGEIHRPATHSGAALAAIEMMGAGSGGRDGSVSAPPPPVLEPRSQIVQYFREHFSSAVWGTFVILSNKAKSSHDWQFQMDLLKMIQELREEKERLDRVIASLEDLRDVMEIDALRKSRRGRKSMGPEERREVSARMRKYWEGQRKQQ